MCIWFTSKNQLVLHKSDFVHWLKYLKKKYCTLWTARNKEKNIPVKMYSNKFIFSIMKINLINNISASKSMYIFTFILKGLRFKLKFDNFCYIYIYIYIYTYIYIYIYIYIYTKFIVIIEIQNWENIGSWTSTVDLRSGQLFQRNFGSKSWSNFDKYHGSTKFYHLSQ